jgi:hypothetical protein
VDTWIVSKGDQEEEVTLSEAAEDGVGGRRRRRARPPPAPPPVKFSLSPRWEKKPEGETEFAITDSEFHQKNLKDGDIKRRGGSTHTSDGQRCTTTLVYGKVKYETRALQQRCKSEEEDAAMMSMMTFVAHDASELGDGQEVKAAVEETVGGRRRRRRRTKPCPNKSFYQLSKEQMEDDDITEDVHLNIHFMKMTVCKDVKSKDKVECAVKKFLMSCKIGDKECEAAHEEIAAGFV